MKRFFDRTLVIAIASILSTGIMGLGKFPKGASPSYETFFSTAYAQAKEAKTDPEALLRQAEKFYEQLEYESALKLLIQIQQLPNLNPVQRARAFLYMGVAFTALGRAENAVQAFMEVLKLRPNFRLPQGVSPSIKAMFGQATKRLKLPDTPPPQGQAGATPGKGAQSAPGPTSGPASAPATTGKGPVSLTVHTKRDVVPGEEIAVEVNLDDPKQACREVVLRWRRRMGPDYSTIRLEVLPGTSTMTAKIPLSALGKKAGRIAYYVEARDASGNALATDGREDEPHEIQIVGAENDSDSGSSHWGWWTLGIGGGLAATAAIVAIVVLAGDSGGQGDRGKLSITIE